MVSVKLVAFAGVTALMASAASAADMPELPMKYPVVEEFAAGWYLRGDIGMSNQKVGSLYNVLYDTASSVTNVHKEFDSAPIFGIGIGYQWNHWMRFDLTGEYRGKSSFHGLDIVRSGGDTYTDEYQFKKSEWLILLNAYLDLGTWYHFTPFIGAGIGASKITIHGFTDTCVIVNVCTGGSVATGATASTWNFAWALHAGVAYKATSNLTIELAYRYVSLGDAQSGDLVTYLGGNTINNPMHFRDITSHDLKLGVRWNLESAFESKPLMLPPLMRKG
jgi:opacity protein-like surface antigen